MAGRWTLAVGLVGLAITLVAMVMGGAEGLSPFVRRALQQEREGRGMGDQLVDKARTSAPPPGKEEKRGMPPPAYSPPKGTPPPAHNPPPSPPLWPPPLPPPLSGGCNANQNTCKTEHAYKSFTKPSCCDNACVDLDANLYNCGSCGKSCAWGLSCSKGHCCDLQTDSQNCGKVGHKCKPGVQCEFGMCGYAH